MLTVTTLAVTVAEADAYAISRGATDWTGDTTAKTAALRRGQDYIAGMYNNRWTYKEPSQGVWVRREWLDTTAPDAVKYAIIEAALREIATPFSLSPDVTPGREKVLTEVKGIKWQAMGNGTAQSFRPIVTAIDLMLNGYAQGRGTVNLQRA